MPQIAVSKASTGASSLVTGVSGKAIHVDSYVLTSGGDVGISFQSGSTNITGVMSTGGDGGGISAPDGQEPQLICAMGQDLKLTLDDAVQVSGSVTYHFVGATAAALPAVLLFVQVPQQVVAGTSFVLTVTALDATGKVATGYSGSVAITTSDASTSITLPSSATLTSGTGTFAATLLTALSQTLIATDTVSTTVVGRDMTNVRPAVLDDFLATAPATATAGTAITVTVEALDAYSNRMVEYAGTVNFTSSDSLAVLPSGSTLGNGIRTFSATLKTAGTKTITATDATTGSINDATSNITVSAAAADHYTLTSSGNATAGSAYNVTVTAKDAYGNTVTGHTGTVNISSLTDENATATSATLTSGVGVFATTFHLAGTNSVSADRATTVPANMLTGIKTGINTLAGALHHFNVYTPTEEVAGEEIDVTVTSVDADDNLVTSYTGTVTFSVTSTDGGKTLPADSTLTSGVGAFQATLTVAQENRVVATDTVTDTIKGTSTTITVAAAAPHHITLALPATGTTGVSVSGTVKAVDAYENQVVGAGSVVSFASTNPTHFTGPGPTPFFSSGVFDFLFDDNLSYTVTATDTVLGTDDDAITISDPS